MYEHHSRPLAPRRVFARRLAASAALGCALLAASLAAGMLGYRYVVGEPWMQAFVDAAMILAGMGPVTTAFDSDAARLFVDRAIGDYWRHASDAFGKYPETMMRKLPAVTDRAIGERRRAAAAKPPPGPAPGSRPRRGSAQPATSWRFV